MRRLTIALPWWPWRFRSCWPQVVHSPSRWTRTRSSSRGCRTASGSRPMHSASRTSPPAPSKTRSARRATCMRAIGSSRWTCSVAGAGPARRADGKRGHHRGHRISAVGVRGCRGTGHRAARRGGAPAAAVLRGWGERVSRRASPSRAACRARGIHRAALDRAGHPRHVEGEPDLFLRPPLRAELRGRSAQLPGGAR